MDPTPDPAREWREVAAGFTRVVDGVADPAVWDAPAPPEGWSARDVVRHLVSWVPDLLAHGAGVTLPAGPDVDGDPAGAWHAFDAGIQALLDDPAADATGFDHPHTGSFPLPVAVSRFVTGDVFLHTWDLARATGQDDTLDPVRCAAMLAGMQAYDAALRASGHYGPAVDVPADADVQTRLIAFTGRDPRR